MSRHATTPADRLRARLREGAVLRSTFVKMASLEVVDLLARCDLDAVTIDLEHSQLDEAEVRRLVRYATALGLPTIVRVPEVDKGGINRMLEAGCAGIQLSTLTACTQVEALVAATRHAPCGSRSVSLAQPAANYGANGLDAYLAGGSSGPLLIGQIETATTVDPLTELVRLLDVAFIGFTDLSVDLGRPGALDAPEVLARVDDVAAAVSSAGGPVLGGWLPTFAAAAPLLERGARFITAGSDLSVLAGAFAGAFGTRTPPTP